VGEGLYPHVNRGVPLVNCGSIFLLVIYMRQGNRFRWGIWRGITMVGGYNSTVKSPWNISQIKWNIGKINKCGGPRLWYHIRCSIQLRLRTRKGIGRSAGRHESRIMGFLDANLSLLQVVLPQIFFPSPAHGSWTNIWLIKFLLHRLLLKISPLIFWGTHHLKTSNFSTSL